MATPSCDGPRHPGARAPGEGSPDLVRSLLATFIEALVGAKVAARWSAAVRHPSPKRTNRRNR